MIIEAAIKYFAENKIPTLQSQNKMKSYHGINHTF